MVEQTNMADPGLETPAKKSRFFSWLGCFFLLALIGFGIVVLIPVYFAARPLSKRTAALSKAKQIALAVTVYTNDFDDRMPPLKSADAAERSIKPYLGHGSDLETLEVAAKSYNWNVALSGKNVVDSPGPAETWMLHSTVEIQEAYAIAFLDGHAKSVTGDELSALLAKPTRHLK